MASLVMVLGLLSGLQHVAAQEKTALPASKVLEARIGVWDTETTIKPIEQFPDGAKAQGVETNEWVLGEKLQQTKNTNRPDYADNMMLVTYDPQKKVFRNWFFDVEGNTAQGTGKWDEDSKTLKWDPVVQGGFRAEGYWRLVDQDNYEWGSVTKDQAGKILVDVTCKLKRRK